MDYYEYYREELFARQTPYLQWIKENEKRITEKKGKHMRRLAFSSCTDNTADIVNGSLRGGIRDDAVYIFEKKGGAEQPDAEAEVAQAFKDNEDVRIVYADEDYRGSLEELYGLEDDGTLYRGAPWFKPDYSPDTLASFFYIGSFFAITGAMLKQGVEENLSIYELVLHAIDMDRKRVAHIPKILYTNNSLDGIDKLEGQGVAEKKTGQAEGLVSVIIPSKNNSAVLEKCLNTMAAKTRYDDYEIIIVDNGSCESEKNKVNEIVSTICAMKEGLEVRFIYEEMPFNFSAMCNIGAKQAKGKYLLFLNDDTEIISDDWLENMVCSAALEHAGAVGAKLYYPDRSKENGCYLIQHDGIANMGIGPAHKLCGLEDRGNLYHGHNLVTYNMIAVTGACMMVERGKFERAGGFDEELAVAYNDVELCFRLYKAGYYNLVRNDVVLVHCESLSRGQDESDEKRRRLENEKQTLYHKHPDMKGRDPFYSPNLVQWKKDVNYNVGYLYACDREVLPVRLDDKTLRTLPKAHKNKYIRRLTGESRSMLTIDDIKTDDIDAPHYEAERMVCITGWHVIRERDNSLADKALLLRDADNNDNIYILPVYPQIRKDVAKLFESEKATSNTALSGLQVIFNRMALAEGSYEIGVIAVVGNERRGYIQWSGSTIDI